MAFGMSSANLIERIERSRGANAPEIPKSSESHREN